MRSNWILCCIPLGALTTLGIPSLYSAESQALQPAWVASLSRPAVVALEGKPIPLPKQGGGVQRPLPKTSVSKVRKGSFCSTHGSRPKADSCSTLEHVPGCSAQMDREVFCSVDNLRGPNARCSVRHNNPGGTASCSVRQKAPTPPDGGSACSVIDIQDGGNLNCSVLKVAGSQCSVTQPGSTRSFCSVIGLHNAPPEGRQCSALGGGRPGKVIRCSVFADDLPGATARCSVEAQRKGRCSVLPGNGGGVCTSFNRAGGPGGSQRCSAFSNQGQCSVLPGIPGSRPTQLCGAN